MEQVTVCLSLGRLKSTSETDSNKRDSHLVNLSTRVSLLTASITVESLYNMVLYTENTLWTGVTSCVCVHRRLSLVFII